MTKTYRVFLIFLFLYFNWDDIIQPIRDRRNKKIGKAVRPISLEELQVYIDLTLCDVELKADLSDKVENYLTDLKNKQDEEAIKDPPVNNTNDTIDNGLIPDDKS